MLPWLVADSSALLSGVRDTSLGKLVRDEMLGLILRGELVPGQRINEHDVAARLRASIPASSCACSSQRMWPTSTSCEAPSTATLAIARLASAMHRVARSSES